MKVGEKGGGQKQTLTPLLLPPLQHKWKISLKTSKHFN